MKYLLIDTATSFIHLAVGSQDQLIDCNSFISNEKQSNETLPSIVELLKKNNLSIQEIDVIFIGIGPGSFTGTRVGVCIAKTIGYSLHIPMVPFCSLTCYSPTINTPFCLITDAKNKKFYAQIGEKNTQGLTFYDTPLLIEKDAVEEYAAQHPLVSPETSLLLTQDVAPASLDLSFVLKNSVDKYLHNHVTEPKEIEVLYLRYAKDL
ncbi:MAG: tRNA (adenosine(37)-N6)-threonylcarbamoyltransferase complex dimerization subunit type 1 TsaB [Chlamydiales bacterium]|nr:tRNA (adenosine(37)-N6)-threonylcarbamoyltransferase complex dimerization subunit type 1 TsaB [Chlamydiales bacterium]